MISQRDSEVNRNLSFFSSEIALAMKADGAAMKTIALVTLTFLPATFVTVSRIKQAASVFYRTELITGPAWYELFRFRSGRA